MYTIEMLCKERTAVQMEGQSRQPELPELPPFMEQFMMSGSLVRALQLEAQGRYPVTAMDVAYVHQVLQRCAR